MTTDTTNVDLTLRVHGDNVAEYTKDGRWYVEGKPGTEYSLRLKNRNAHRVKVVISIDGVSAISGKPVTEAADEAGYIMGAYEMLDVKGYRLDDTDVAAFKFVTAEKGYAQAENGMKGTTGVIGVRVYKEKVTIPTYKTVIKEVHHHHDHNYWYDQYWYGTRPHWYWGSLVGSSTTANDNTLGLLNCTSTAGNAGIQLNGTNSQVCSYNMSVGETAASSDVASASLNQSNQSQSLDDNPFNLGSTFGQKTESRVTAVSFVVDVCLGVIELYYSTRAGLIALGVDVTRKPKVAFPAAFSGKYAQPPAGWVG